MKGVAIILAVALVCPHHSDATLHHITGLTSRIVPFISSFFPDFSGRVQIDDKLILFGPHTVGEPVPEPIVVPEPVPVPVRPYPIPIPVPEIPVTGYNSELTGEGHAYEPAQGGYDVSNGYQPHFLSYSEPGTGRDVQFAIPPEALEALSQEELRNLHASAGGSVSVGGSGYGSNYGSGSSGYDSPQIKEEEIRNIHGGAAVVTSVSSGGPSGYGYGAPAVKEVVRNIHGGGAVSTSVSVGGGSSGYGGYNSPQIKEEIRNIHGSGSVSTSVSVGGGHSGYGYNSPQVKEEVIEEVVPAVQEQVDVVQGPEVVEQRTEIVEPVIQKTEVVESGPVEHVQEEVRVDEPAHVTEVTENNIVEEVQTGGPKIDVFRNIPKAPVMFRKEINTIH